MSIFEAGMLVCFGLAWPINIVKSYKSRTTAGKSILFEYVIEIGYISGITHKLLYSRDIVLILYIINFLMVFVDILLFYRNKKLDRERTQTADEPDEMMLYRKKPGKSD